jgi:ornithine carbamoyltransferase
MAIKHFLQFNDLSTDELNHVFARAKIIKAQFKAYQQYWPLQDRTLVMIFEKASTRTRLSFEAGMQQLGGSAIYLNTRDSQLGRGEPVEDAAQVISRMSDIVMIRTFEQDIIERFAANSRVPVINGLTNEYHPCQILADIFTFIEHRGSIKGKTVAWIGAIMCAIHGCKPQKCSILTCMSARRRVTRLNLNALIYTGMTILKPLPTRWTRQKMRI